MLEQLEDRSVLSFVAGAGVLTFNAAPGEPNDVTITPGLFTNIVDNPNLSLLSIFPSAEFLRGLSAGFEVSFIAGASFSFPVIPFDLPNDGVLAPSIAGFASMLTAAAQSRAEPGSASVVAGATVPESGNLFFKVTADGDDPISDYRLYHVIADPAMTHADSAGGNLQADGSVFRSATPGTGRIVTGSVAAGQFDRFSFDATAGKRYVVMLDQNPERSEPLNPNRDSITSTRLKAYTIGGAIINSPLAQNISVVGGNAIGPFSVGSNQPIVLDVENVGVGTDTSYRFVVAEFDDADSVTPLEGPQTFSTSPALAIPDNTTVNSTLNVAGLTGTITDVDVTLDITHTFDADLDVFLISPNLTQIELFTDVGGSDNNFTNTTLDDGFSFNPITGGSAPFSSTFSPEGLLSALNGEPANGTWTLRIIDDAGTDVGTLNSWSIKVTTSGNNDSKANATALTAGSFGKGAIDPARDIDYWSRSGVTANSLAFSYVDTSGSALNKDSRLELSVTNPFEQADDGGPPGIDEELLKDLKKRLENAGVQAPAADFTGVFVDLGDRDDRVNLRALSGLSSTVLGGPGQDTIIGSLAGDILDGGPGSDSIEGTAGDDVLKGGTEDDTFIVDTEYGPQTDTVYGGDENTTADNNGYDTIFVPSSAQKNDITVTLKRTAVSTDVKAIIDVSGVATNFIIPKNDVDEIQISGGDGADTLSLSSIGITDDETVIYIRGPHAGSGAIYVMNSSGELSDMLLTLDGIEQINFLDGLLTRADGSSRLLVFSDASFEKGANDIINLATLLGAGGAVNLDPAIFPAGDADTFQFVAQYTGTLDFRVFFQQQNGVLPGDGNLDIEVLDVDGHVIASGTSSDDDEQLIISAVKDQVYFLRVFGATGPAINDYDITVINAPAPIPTAVVLDPTDDSGTSDLDQVTLRTSQLHYFVHADLEEFANAGIAILTPAQAAAGVTPGAAVEVFNEGVSVGFASAVAGSNNTIFEINVDANLAKFPVRGPNLAGPLGYDGYVNFLTAAVTVFDGKQDASSAPAPAVGRSLLSDPLSVTVDNVAPLPPSAPDLLTSSDSSGCPGSSPTDNITNINAPAFSGTGEANTIVRIFANGIQVGLGQVGSDVTDGVPNNGLGTWEVTVEPLDDGIYNITANLEDLAGNFGVPSPALSVTIDTHPPQRPTLDLADISDSGRNNKDNITNDALTALPGFLRFRVTSDPGTWVIIKDGNTVIDGPFLMPAAGFVFRDISAALFPADRNYLLSAESNDIACNVSAQSEELIVEVDRTTPGAPSFRLHPSTDSGVGNDPATLIDRITSNTVPEFVGNAEADAVVRLFVQLGGGPVADGQTVAIPVDGNQAFTGQWNLVGVRNLNDPTGPFGFDGLRDMRATAEDRAGNVSVVGSLPIFIDTEGPQVTGVQITGSPGYNLFGQKPANASLHPTPLVNSLTIQLKDLPARVTGFLYNAIDPATAFAGNFVVKGDATGIASISSISLVNDPPVNGGVATASIQIVFAQPLPDDRFTLTIGDNLQDPAGNKLDGESNAAEPNAAPGFPSGDGKAGGAFVARFTVDTRAELGAWASGSVYVDTNGNYTFDPTNPDFTNRDISYLIGFSSDNIFAGNFVGPAAGAADGFDKLAAYGKVGANFRWLIDTNNDGVADLNVVQPLFPGVTNINGTPVAGNFDGNAANGDEVALKVGNVWLIDTNHDFKVDTKLVGANMGGLPVVGDFDGDGKDDLGSWADDRFLLDLTTAVDGSTGALDGTADKVFGFGFASVRERPVAADFDGDGITDLGLWVPDRAGAAPWESAEWYLLISGGRNISDRLAAGGGAINFTPTPFGNDRFAQFGDEFGLPIVGNFDPPVTPTLTYGSFTNYRESADVNNDGFISPLDALLVINRINDNGPGELTPSLYTRAPYVDVNGDGFCAPIDALLIINWLTSHPNGNQSAEGESVDAYYEQLGSSDRDDVSLTALLAADDYDRRRK